MPLFFLPQKKGITDHTGNALKNSGNDVMCKELFVQDTLAMYTARFLPEQPANYKPCGDSPEAGLKVLAGAFLGSCMASDDIVKKNRERKHAVKCNGSNIHALAVWMALKELKRKNASVDMLPDICRQTVKKCSKKYNVLCDSASGFDSALAIGGCVAGAFSDDPKEVIRMAAMSSYHPSWHPEGMRGSIVSAVCVWMALHQATIEEITRYACNHYGKDTAPVEYCFSHGRITVDMTMDDLLGTPSYQLTDNSCIIVVPEALFNLIHSDRFTSAIRTAQTYPCDKQSVPSLTGALAGALYNGVPGELLKKYKDHFPVELRARLAP